MWADARAREMLREVFDAAIASADPRLVLAQHLPIRPSGRCIVVGAGKSGAGMAAALEAAWPDVQLSGAVVIPHGLSCPTTRIEMIEAAYPVPDANSERAARRIMALVEGLGPDDMVLALISSGGSALLTLPAPGISFAAKQAVCRALLASGAGIQDINVVRKHLSAIKGGRLAEAAHPARLVTLAISDVPGDDPSVIASGPTMPDPSHCEDAVAVLTRFGIALPAPVARYLRRREETPKPGAFATDFRLIATPGRALHEAASVARDWGVTPLILGDALEGESREVGTVMAGIARSVREHGLPVPRPALLLSGGGTTVTLGDDPQPNHVGPNSEFLLGLAVGLAGEPGIWAIAGNTDGIDGSGDAAGAIVTPDTLQRARAARLDPREILSAHESYRLFDATGDLVRTGPTQTSVNDFRAILIV